MPPATARTGPGGAAQEGALPMQQEATVTYPQLRPRSGVLVVDGYGITLRVHRGRLLITDGIGEERRSRELLRSSREVRRVVLLGHTGYLTLEAMRWMTDVGIGFCNLDSDGRLISTSAFAGRNDPQMRRAQALSAFGDSGFEMAHRLVGRKISGQAQVLSSRHTGAAEKLGEYLHPLDAAETLGEVRRIEAAAAVDYWRALANTELRFDRASTSRIPERWRSLGQRQSGLGAGARLATNPANAILNYCYALAEIECRLALTAMGLDPGLGVLHADQKARDSLALDLMEPIRPEVDAWFLDLLGKTTLRVSDFHETRQGSCRLLAPLTHHLAETLSIWRRLAAPAAEEVAKVFTTDAGLSAHTPLTQSRRSLGRNPVVTTLTTKPYTTPTHSLETGALVVKRCMMCGIELARTSRRKVCDACLPEANAQRTERLRRAGRAALVRMRMAAKDPAQSQAAKSKRIATSRERMLAVRAWERRHGKTHDWDRYQADVVPILSELTVPELVSLTGLSSHYCWQVRAGRKRLHPMHWSLVIEFGHERSDG